MKQKQVAFLKLLFISGILFLISSCKHDGALDSEMPTINFTEQVLPIFKNSCATSGCHNGAGESGYIFTDYANIMKGITPGNANKSEAYKATTSTLQLMPPDNALSKSQRTIIWLWIEQGANP